MIWDPETPYNTLPPLPPAAELDTRAILNRCITARAALAELKQAAALLPQAVEATARWTTEKISAIRALAEHTAVHMRDRLPKIYSRELTDLIFELPHCSIGNIVEKGIVQRHLSRVTSRTWSQSAS
jgi:hypothetical protein